MAFTESPEAATVRESVARTCARHPARTGSPATATPASWRHDRGLDCGAAADVAAYLAAEAGFEACQRPVVTLGGFGRAAECHGERDLREVMVPHLVPVSAELVLSFIAERVLGLPTSC